MSWKDKLRPASFKGISFEVEDTDSDTGRRSQLHEYPNRDTPFNEDLGKKAERYSFVAFILGDDCLDRAAELRNACKNGGTGTLIHPAFGTALVDCESCKVSYSFREGRMARISLSFVEHGQETYPDESTDLVDSVYSAADKLETATINNFVQRFNIEEVGAIAGDVSALATSYAGAATEVLEDVSSKIGIIIDGYDDLTTAVDNITTVADSVMNIRNNINDVLNGPAQFAAHLSAIFETVRMYSGKSDGIRNLKNISTPSSSGGSTTDSGSSDENNTNDTSPISVKRIEAQQENVRQMTALTERLTLSNEAKIIADTDFENTDEADEALETFLEDVENQLLSETETSHDVIEHINEIKAVVIENIRERVSMLPQTKTIILPEMMPSIVLAYDLYEDIERRDEIVKRNKISNPAFIPAGVELKVLND